jgi:hypothetical protein
MRKTNMQALKKQYDRVQLRHVRPDNHTGATVAIVVKDNIAYVGYSLCHDADQFDRKKGRNIAIGRAIALYNRSGAENGKFGAFAIPAEGVEPAALMETAVEQVLAPLYE